MKREDYLNWDEFFMGVAALAAQRSKDPHTQVGSCIVSSDNKIVSTGYNGAPTGYDDDSLPWNRGGDFINSKYAYVCHSEENAIFNSPVSVKGCRIYLSLFPCNECAKAIVQSGIKEVIYSDDKYKDADNNIVSEKILTQCGVTYRKYQSRGKKITLDL